MRAVEGEEKAFHSISATVGGMRKGERERECLIGAVRTDKTRK